MREKLSSIIKIHLVTVLMTACSAGGNCILGVSCVAAAFEGKLAGWAGLAISEMVMFLSADAVLFTKYTGMLAVMAAFTLISRTMNDGKTEDIRARSLYAGTGMTLLELTDSLFGALSIQDVGIALWYGIACAILTTLFSKGLKALLAGEVSFRAQRSENMISAACFLGAASYAVICMDFLPDFVLQSLVCLLLLYMGHTCGPAMGAVTGAAVGIVLSFFQTEISYLGILCFLGLLCGMFRELGRLAETIAFFAGAAGMMFCGVPFLAELKWLTGVLAAGGLWILCDMLLAFRDRLREKRDEAECAGTIPGYYTQNGSASPWSGSTGSWSGSAVPWSGSTNPCGESVYQWGRNVNLVDGEKDPGAMCTHVLAAEEDRMAEILGEFAQEVLAKNGLDGRGPVYPGDDQPQELSGRFWEEKYLETRDTLAVWMSETGEILKNRHASAYAFKEPEEERAGLLKKRLRERGVRVHEVWQKQDPDGQTVLRFLWSTGDSTEKKQSRPVMVKDLLPVINDSFGMAFEPAHENRSLVGKEQAVYEFIRVPNFKILHGSATTKKSDEDGNGDTFGVAQIGTTQVLFGIADGVGSGRAASDEAAHALEQLEQLLKSGISEETSLRLIDSLEVLKGRQGAALDFGVINLNTGICHLLKAGGAPGFILRGPWVEMIDAGTLPLGLLPGTHYEQKVKKLYDGDVILLVSDGVFQAFSGEDRAREIGNYLMQLGEMGPGEIARSLLDRALSFGRAADDMSVLAIGVYEA